MLNKTKIALSLAVILGTASAASAATKHPVRHETVPALEQQVPVVSEGIYGYSATSGTAVRLREPTYIAIQDQFLHDSLGE